MDEKQKLLRHFLAALAYQTQKALRDAQEDFGSFHANDRVRTPAELVPHMTSVLGYARTFFIGGHYRPDPLPSFEKEIARFHDMVQDLARHLEVGTSLLQGISLSFSSNVSETYCATTRPSKRLVRKILCCSVAE